MTEKREIAPARVLAYQHCQSTGDTTYGVQEGVSKLGFWHRYADQT